MKKYNAYKVTAFSHDWDAENNCAGVAIHHDVHPFAQFNFDFESIRDFKRWACFHLGCEKLWRVKPVNMAAEENCIYVSYLGNEKGYYDAENPKFLVTYCFRITKNFEFKELVELF